MVGIAVTDAALHEKTADFDFFDYEADETKPVDWSRPAGHHDHSTTLIRP